MRRVIACLALLVVASCESGTPAQATQHPGPSTATAGEWQEFPVARSPRPIVFFYSMTANIARPAAWPPFECGKFIGAGSLPQGSPGMAYATWSDHDEGFPAISAADALAAMSRLAPKAGSADCSSVTATTVLSAQFGHATFATDRGDAWMSAWLFQIAGSRSIVGFPALPVSAFWKGGLTPKSPNGTAFIDASGRRLTVGLCGGSHSASVAESSTVVQVSLIGQGQASAGCSDVPYSSTYSSPITVTLDRPLGGRVVVDSNGLAMEVCSTIKGCG
jgi:hypothetical protein